MNAKIIQFNYDAALAISNKIKLNYFGENTTAPKFDNMSIAEFLIKARSTLEEIYNVIENNHLKLIAENSLPFVDQLILDCEYALISINSMNFKIEILMMDGINKIQTNSALIKSLFCKFFNKIQLICEEETDQVKAFFARIMGDVELLKTKFSSLILQLVETSTGFNLATNVGVEQKQNMKCITCDKHLDDEVCYKCIECRASELCADCLLNHGGHCEIYDEINQSHHVFLVLRQGTPFNKNIFDLLFLK
jgi:hypothetical protein